MGRRSLPKIPTGCDLSQHYYERESLATPLDVDAWFPGGPLEIEMGSGKGLFLTSSGAQWPKRRFLGVEMSGKYARFAASRFARRGLPNVRMIHGNGELLFTEQLGDAIAEAVHIYFPDPWWKKRHRKRRVMNPTFLSQVTRVLMPGGALHFWTDVREYFEVSIETIRDSTPLEGPEDVPENAANHDLDYRTHFERRTRMLGLPVYRAIFRRSEGDIPVGGR